MSSSEKSSDPIVVAEGLARVFGVTAALRSVSLTVSSGEMVGVVGPNGGGKSTLLLLLAGLLRPTTGSVRVCDVVAHDLALQTKGLVGLVTARPGLYPLLTGRENLHHFGGLYGLTESEVDDKATPLLETLGLKEGADKRAAACSSGMQQKLSLVRALLLSPKLLLLDEPTANVDPVVAEVLYTELRRRADGGLAVVLATHDLRSVEAICDRALLLDTTIRSELAFDERRSAPQGPLLEAWKTAVAS